MTKTSPPRPPSIGSTTARGPATPRRRGRPWISGWVWGVTSFGETRAIMEGRAPKGSPPHPEG